MIDDAYMIIPVTPFSQPSSCETEPSIKRKQINNNNNNKTKSSKMKFHTNTSNQNLLYLHSLHKDDLALLTIKQHKNSQT